MQEQRSACDSCRRRKVRCDSGQPCRRCLDTGVQCTYGSSLRRSGTWYTRSLEQRVAELEQQLRAEAHTTSGSPMPLASSTATAHLQSDMPSDTRQRSPGQQHPIDLLVHAGDDLVVRQPSGTRIYRFSAALNILRTIADLLDVGLTDASSPSSPGLALVEAIDPPLEIRSRDTADWLDAVLPPKSEAHRLISCAIDRALVCHQCIDRQAFELRVNELYNPEKIHIVSKDKSFMSLVYAVLALGQRYTETNAENVKPQADTGAALAGFQYFRASRCVTHADVDRGALDHVLARLLQARYLLSISHVSEAHGILGRGISVATHLGLHFDDSALSASYSSNELDERRCIFAVLYMMDVYLSFILGLPRTLSYAHYKQTLGLRSSDLHDEGRALLARDPTSPTAETVMAQKMFRIYAKILDHQSSTDIEYNDWVADVQHDFQDWEAMLPNLPSNPSDTDSRQLLGQLTLRMHCTGGKMLLYAPFIHHLGRERSDSNFNIDGFTYGSDCVRAAAQTVLLAEILQAQKMLNGALWMNGFVLTLAASILTYFVQYSTTRVTIEESKEAIMKAGRMLQSLGQTSAANRRAHESLSPYVDIVLGLTDMESQ